MAEIHPDVYDFIHPTPVSLKQLSAMAVSLQIWRCEASKHRKSNTLKKFRPMIISKRLSEKSIFPDLPSTITNLIEEYVRKFASSLLRWLYVHYYAAFHFHYDHESYILKEFDDLVCDYNGTVDYQRTAERMMQSDRLSEAVKFKIACMYFFEDDIRRIWPSVCEELNLNDIDINESPGLYYWICYLRNDLANILIRHGNSSSVNEIMFIKCSKNIGNKRSLLYFWNRIPLESRMQKAYYPFAYNQKSFVRFLLRKLDDEELVDFVNANGVKLMHSLLVNLAYDETFILSTWMYIKNIMIESTLLANLVVDMLQSEAVGLGRTHYQAREVGNWVYYCFEILNSVPCDLKLSVIRNILSNNNDVFVKIESLGSRPWRTIEFLLGILSYVTFEERYVFWQNYWHYLIKRTRVKDLRRIMEICFKNEDEIVQFKENTIAESEILRSVCVSLLTRYNDKFFKELNELVRFCYSDTETAIRFAQKILQSVLLGEDSRITCDIINRFYKELSEFIDDVHQNADLSADFKNQLLSSPIFQHRLTEVACSVADWDRSKIIIDLIETFVSSEQTMQQIKTRMVDAVKEKLNSNILQAHRLMAQPHFNKFLVWCLRSQEEFTKFQLFCNSKFERMY